MSSITPFDASALDTSLSVQEAAEAAVGGSDLFAVQLAQMLAANVQAQNAASQSSLTTGANSTAALATQVVQNQAGSGQSSTAATTQAGSTQASTSQTSSQAMLQSLNLQAALALSQGNGQAFTSIETIIALMNVHGTSQAATTSASAAANASTPTVASNTGSNLPFQAPTVPVTHYPPLVPNDPIEYMPTGFNT
jgi:hypothetical protein